MKKSIIANVVLSVFLLNFGQMRAAGASLKVSGPFCDAHPLSEDNPLSDGAIVYYDNHHSWYTILVAYRVTTALAYWERLSKETQDAINAHPLTAKTLEYLLLLALAEVDCFVFFQLPPGQASLRETDKPLTWKMYMIPDDLFPLKMRKPVA